MTQKFALALTLALMLNACQAAQQIATVSDAQTAVDKTASAIATIKSNASNLTKAQTAACAGQALANTLTDMLDNTGHTAASKASSEVSTLLGAGCTYRPAKS